MRWRRCEVSRPRRVTPRFPSIIHRAAAASALVFNSPDNHIIPPPKRERNGSKGGGRWREKETDSWDRRKAPARYLVPTVYVLLVLLHTTVNLVTNPWWTNACGNWENHLYYGMWEFSWWNRKHCWSCSITHPAHELNSCLSHVSYVATHYRKVMCFVVPKKHWLVLSSAWAQNQNYPNQLLKSLDAGPGFRGRAPGQRGVAKTIKSIHGAKVCKCIQINHQIR